MINSIKENPHKFLLKVIIVFGSLKMAVWKYDQKAGYSSSNQGDIEQFFRMILGSIIMYIPSLIVYTIIYWLMHRFKRPTRIQLNLWHIGLLVLNVVIGIGYGLFLWYDKSPISLQTSLGEYIMMAIGVVTPIIFIYNVIISLVRPLEMETLDKDLPLTIKDDNDKIYRK